MQEEREPRAIRFGILLISLFASALFDAGARGDEPETLSEAVNWLEKSSHRIIRASRRAMKDGTSAFPPQAGSGYEAFWLRDYAYTLEGSIDTYADEELIAACMLFVKNLRPDGAGVDCVKFDGTPIYKPGYGTMGDHPVADGSQFTVAVAWHTYNKTKNRQFLREVMERLVKTMNAVPRNPHTRLVHIDPKAVWDRCPYGFTDTIRKKGDVLFSSLLYVQAGRRLSELLRVVDRKAEAGRWKDESERVAESIRNVFWDADTGLFRAATVCCKEHDIWGSAFAVYLGVADGEQSETVAAYFKKHYAQLVQKGQIRHLPGGVYWEKGCKRDTYQNGAYWATPTGWFVYTLNLADPVLADQTVIDLVDDFKEGGICEWIFGATRRLPDYLASASLPLAGVRAMIERRKGSLDDEPVDYTLAAQNLEVRFSLDGKIVGVELTGAGSAGAESVDVESVAGESAGVKSGPDGVDRPVSAETTLAGCRLEGKVGAVSLDQGGVEFEKRFVHETGGQQAVVVERFLPGEDSIRWEVEVRGQGAPWSAPIETRVSWPEPGASLFWTAWGDPRPDGKGWADPLQPTPWMDRQFLYGGHHPFKDVNTFSLPLATILDRDRDQDRGMGMSLVLSPEDLVLTMRMKTTAQGSLTFSREHHRLCADNVVRFAMDLTAHRADWRGGVQWLVRRYPTYFDPPNPAVQIMAGCGAYSSHRELSGIERLMQMAFRVNWKASFDFPYMGMFLPPVASDDETWIDFKGQETSIAGMRDAAETLRRSGFYLLNYFNVTELGAHSQYPPPSRKAAADADLWRDANDFLFYGVGDGILPGPDGKPIRSWMGCVAMDPGEKVYQDFLVDQARRHIERIPESSGICIDRMDWIWCYNRKRDDGLTWYEGGPARSLVVSWHGIMKRLGPLMHDAGKVIYGNPLYARIDLLRLVDGVYDEHGQHPTSLNACAIMALNKPIMVWTWQLDLFDDDTDDYFQRHLHLGAYLTAPVPGNDHTILPDPGRDQFYYDYGPLLDALRGKRWVLKPHVIAVEDKKALANLFEVPGGFVAPVTFGGEEVSVNVELRGLPRLPGQKGFLAEALHPGEPEPVTLGIVGGGDPVVERDLAETKNMLEMENPTGERNLLRVDVPLRRGCAVLLLKHTWMEPKAAFFYDGVQASIHTTLEDVNIRYTLDGGEPAVRSPRYTAPVELHRTTVVKAATYRSGKKIGATLEREYVRIPPGAPSIIPPGGFFNEALEVMINTPRGVPAGIIRYTLDGTTPTWESPRYTDSLRIDDNLCLQAKRFFPDSESLPVVAQFTRRGPKPPVPDISLEGLTPLKATVGWGGHHRVNRSINDSPLSLGGTVYEHGIGAHADSILDYKLEPEYSRFVAIIGVDDGVTKYGGGTVVFEVWTDDQRIFSTPVMRPGDYAHVDVAIPATAEIIRLEATDAGDGISCDHADWVEAGFLFKKK